MPAAALPPSPATPPPAPPAPATPESQIPDPMAPQQIRTLKPDDDPNHHMAQLISKRRRKAEAPKEGEAAPAAPAAATPPSANQPPAESDPKSLEGLNNLILKTLAGSKRPEKPKPAAEEPPKEAPATPPAEAPATPPAAPAKSIVSKKKAAPAVPDVAEIAAAVSTATANAMGDVLRADRKPADAKKPEANLKPDDLHDYEVAVKMAEMDPRYKDAPRLILEHVKQAEDYAARWQTANPGKEFNPDDEEHNEFYDRQERPWSDHEFRNAEIEMAAERVSARVATKSETRIKALEKDNARLELNPVVDQTLMTAAAHLAKGLGVYEKVVGNFDEFAKEDPVMARAINSALIPMRPLIEAIVHIDEPKARFEIDDKSPAHQAWKELVIRKEAEYAGTEYDGKMFATRYAYLQMTPAQRARHWYLTENHLISEVVRDAVESVSTRVAAEKEEVKKMAEAMGYVPAPPKAGTKPSAGGAGAPPAPAPSAQQQPPPEQEKPVSPTVGSGAKIDSKGTPNPVGKAATLSAMHNVLFS